MSYNSDSGEPSGQTGDASLDEVIYDLCVNFLLYVVLIIVFYMLVRFYLEEETQYQSYEPLSMEDTDQPAEQVTTPAKAADSDNTANSGLADAGLKRRRNNSFLNLNEWGAPETETKEETLQKLALCSGGLIVCFCLWGLLQERMLTQTYDGEYFTYSYGLVFMSRVGGLILSGALMYYFKEEWQPAPLWEYSFPSVANMLSSWCQYEALRYVSFPAQMLAKGFKMVPVMLMGVFLHEKHYESYEYMSAMVVGFGLYLFLDSSEHIDFSQNVIGEPENVRGSMCGVVLLLLYLFFDSFTSQWQTRMFHLNKALAPLQMMLIMNAFSAVFSAVTLCHQGEFLKPFLFMVAHPLMFFHLCLFCLFATVGQVFIFYTVKHFGAVVFSIIMSMRILASTILSCLVYNHPITELGLVGMMMVFGSMGYRIQRKVKDGPLLKWKEHTNATAIFHEWHEHCDV
jgi:solute carrier family 35 (adenosine 3'-phospho 5'-phosphosulfate transporter), member B2